MTQRDTPWLQAKAALARAKAADLDQQAREIEKAASSGSWRQRAKASETASRVRMRAGEYLVKAQQLEDSSDR